MRIGSYNLYEGAQNTGSELREYVAQHELDVLCIQEANGWNDGTPTRLESFGVATGLTAQVYGDSNTRFKLATLSRQPIISAEVYTEGFWHSAIHTAIQYGDDVLHIWNMHLDPIDEDHRVPEAKRLVEMIDPRLHTIITGDFNSLSRADQYPDDLITKLAAQGITKFGTDSLRFDVTDYFARAGFTDAAVSLGNLETTVPTRANHDAYHAADLRLDYMFVSGSLAKVIRNIDVSKDELTDKISDHYPQVLTLEASAT